MFNCKFSGEGFNVDESVGLNGTCDFLISASAQQMAIKAPVIMILLQVKKGDLRAGVGQCAAEMIAAQQFNRVAKKEVSAIYGCLTSGTEWRFMRIVEQTLEVDPQDYNLFPVAQILGFLVWMIKSALKY